jgi:hypothetical protein
LIRQEHLTGGASEFFAASEYMRRGYEVFWPSVSQSAADFVLLRGGEFLKVQVKTGTWARVGPYRYLQCRLYGRTKKTMDPAQIDLMVIVDVPRLWQIPLIQLAGLTSLCLDSDGPRRAYSRKKYNPDVWILK